MKFPKFLHCTRSLSSCLLLKLLQVLLLHLLHMLFELELLPGILRHTMPLAAG